MTRSEVQVPHRPPSNSRKGLFLFIDFLCNIFYNYHIVNKTKMENFKKKFEKERIEIISQEVPQEIKDLNPIYSQIDKMPKGCAVIGGAARSLAFMMINPKNRELIPVRDVDVAYFEDDISQEEADVYAEYFSPDDFLHNHGVQEISNIEEYMNTRDFTMNQVIYKDGKLIASRAVMYDIYIDDFYCSEYNGFQLAVAIQKSFDWGDDFPEKFLQNLVKSPIFEEDLSFY